MDAVGFVVQSSLARLTSSQTYIFNSVLEIFGKDIGENILFLTTFADGDEPKVLAAIKEAKLPCKPDSNGLPCYKSFNNYVIYKSPKSPNAKRLRLDWEEGLRGNPLSTLEYIQMIIDDERNDEKPGYEERIKSLKDVLERARITQGNYTTTPGILFQ